MSVSFRVRLVNLPRICYRVVFFGVGEVHGPSDWSRNCPGVMPLYLQKARWKVDRELKPLFNAT